MMYRCSSYLASFISNHCLITYPLNAVDNKVAAELVHFFLARLKLIGGFAAQAAAIGQDHDRQHS